MLWLDDALQGLSRAIPALHTRRGEHSGEGAHAWHWRRSRSGSGSVGTSRNRASTPTTPLEWERRDAHIPNWKDGTDAFRQDDVEFPVSLVAELHQHRRPEVLPGHPRHRRARDVAAPGDRPRRRHDHVVGREGRLLHRRGRGRRVPQRAQGDPRHPARRVQLAGVVQHRREGRAAAGERVLHPRRRRHDGRHPQLVPRGRHDLQGRFRFGHQPLQHPLVAGAPQGRRHRQRSGELHARRRRVGRHDQERRQDPPRRQDGHPQRRPPRRRGVHLVQVA